MSLSQSKQEFFQHDNTVHVLFIAMKERTVLRLKWAEPNMSYDPGLLLLLATSNRNFICGKTEGFDITSSVHAQPEVYLKTYLYMCTFMYMYVHVQ